MIRKARTLDTCSICKRSLYILRITPEDVVIACTNCDMTAEWPTMKAAA